MTVISTSLRPSVPLPRKHPLPHVEAQPRQQLLDQATAFYQRASQAASEGDLAESARLILAALDCERRAGGVGPQVLQLIKPRA